MNRRRLIRVPASSANLGPGFDVLAAALSPTLTLEVEETGVFAVETALDVPLDRSNLIVQAFERLHPADGFTFRVSSEIPLTGGLGSSASAVLAGLAAADHIFELGVDLLEHATAIEGHPDNAAAALHGGFVVCAGGGEVTRVNPPTGLEALIAVPPASHSVPTEAARAALPAEIPLADSVFSQARAVMLALGLERADSELIGRGLEDAIHQPRRAHLFPESIEVMQQARQWGALGATISGAGPTVLIWTDWESTGNVFEAARAAAPAGWQINRATFTPQGLDVQAL